MRFQKKPVLHNFLAIKTTHSISLKLSISIIKEAYTQSQSNQEILLNSTPWQNIDFLTQSYFKIKIIGLNAENEITYVKLIETNKYAELRTKIPSHHQGSEILHIQLFETSFYEGVEILLGSFIPTSLKEKTNLIISDFDKTLVQTKYSTVKEIYQSLNSPLNKFPKIQESIDLLKSYISQDFTPFILSASPHFYEKPFRNWLYQNQIYTNNIFLKNYRKIFSFFDNDLTSKDISRQGYYKLNQLIDILLMTGIPQKLVLIGDVFESDTFVYLILRSILTNKIDSNTLCSYIKDLPPFQIKTKQISNFLLKLNQLEHMVLKSQPAQVKVYIRCLNNQDLDRLKLPGNLHFIENQKKFVNFYNCDSTT